MQHPPEAAAARRAARAGDDQPVAFDPRRRPVLIGRSAVGLDVRDDEGHPFRIELAVDERQRCRVAAQRAVDTADLFPANRELVGVRVGIVGSPSAAIAIGGLCGSALGTGHDDEECHECFHLRQVIPRSRHPVCRPGRRRGLGLLGIRERVSQLQGTVRLESRAAGGTRLEVCLPLSEPDAVGELVRDDAGETSVLIQSPEVGHG